MKLYHRFLTVAIVSLISLLVLIFRRHVPGYPALVAWEYNSNNKKLSTRESIDDLPPLPSAIEAVPETGRETKPCPTVNTSSHNNLPILCAQLMKPSNSTASTDMFNRIFVNPSIDLSTEQFTIVILTYKRVALLRMVIPHYCDTGSKLHKVVVIWNDVGTSIPNDIENHSCAVPLVFIKSKENKLTNRFIPYPEVETDGMFV